MMMVYFQLQKMSKPKVENHLPYEPSTNVTLHEIVSDIRANADAANDKDRIVIDHAVSTRYVFSIFDGTPSEDSPWKKYIDQDYDDDDYNQEEKVAWEIHQLYKWCKHQN